MYRCTHILKCTGMWLSHKLLLLECRSPGSSTLSFCLSHVGDANPSAPRAPSLVTRFVGAACAVSRWSLLPCPAHRSTFGCGATQGTRTALFLPSRVVENTHKLVFGLLHLVSPEEGVNLNSFPGVLVIVVALCSSPKGLGVETGLGWWDSITPGTWDGQHLAKGSCLWKGSKVQSKGTDAFVITVLT